MNDKDKQDLEITEQFIREYCTRTELETKARDAALLLLNQLEECRNPSCICKKEEHKEEEPKPAEEVEEEAKEETKEEAPQEEKEEPVISEEKFQKLQNTRQGKKSYREYLRNQLKVIGLAGIIAMSTAVYAQSQVIYKNGIIIYAVLEKEFPILTTIKKLVISDETPSQSQSNSNGSSSDSGASVSSSSSTSGSTFSSTNAESETNTASVEVNNTEVGPPLTPAEQEQIKKGEELLEEEKKEVTNLDPKPNQFGTPIVPPTTTNTNPQSE